MKVLLLVLLFLPSIISTLRFGSTSGLEYLFNYTDGQDWCGPSYECDIITFLCNEVNNNQPCSLKVFETLNDRITSLENDEVDIVVSRFSVTPERTMNVDFVRPYYLSSGAQLFVRPEDSEVITSFDMLASFSVCMDTGYYVSATLADQYGLTVFPSVQGTMLNFINRGYCAAAVSDSIFSIEGLVPVGTSEYTVPYGVAIAKNPSKKNLYEKVQTALLKMFIQSKDKNESMIQQLYQQYLGVIGIEESKELQILSMATTELLGAYIGQEQEDEIWQAANLSLTEDFYDRLFFADPELEEPCFDALEEIYNSYANGTQLEEVSIYFKSQESFSMIFDVTYMDQFFDFVVHHPFVQPNTTSTDVESNNPQIRVLLQIRKIALEENNNDGDIYYVLIPSNTTQFVSNSTEDQPFSPTRVMSTFLAMTIQGRGKDEGRTFQVICGIGRIEDW